MNRPALDEKISCSDYTYLDPQHEQELRNSAISEEIKKHFRSVLDGSDYILYSPKLKRRNDGRLSDGTLRRYQHLQNGGLHVSGLDPSNDWEEMSWGCLKPNTPYIDKDGKVVKYEHPPGEQTRAFFFGTPVYWRRVQADISEIITITEGAKKAACLESAGFATIGLPGVTGAVRTKDAQGNKCQPYPIKEIELFAQEGRHFRICFDRDLKRKTVRNVNREIRKLAKLLERRGCKVSIVTWDTPEKGIDDFVMAHGVDALKELFDKALPFDEWNVKWLKQLTYEPSFTTSERYLPDLPIPAEARLIGLKSAKGTGKTEAIARIAHQAMTQERRVLLVSHRVQLTQALCDRVGVPSVYELKAARQAGEEDRLASDLEYKLRGYGLCIDSLHPHSQAQFSAQDWEDALIIIDEAEQVIWHGLNASTCKGDRVKILREFQDLLARSLCPETTGQVILSDADLSDIAIDFVKDVAGQPDLTPWIAINNWKPEQGWKVFHYPAHEVTVEEDETGDRKRVSGKEDWLSALDDRVKVADKAAGKAVMILVDSQKPKAAWSTYNLEQRYQSKFPNKKILRIDSQTLENKDHPAFGCITHLNEVLRNYDVVIASPSIETGVSIDIRGHFDSVWGCFQGNLPENSVRQMLARVREPVERHIWLAPYGIGAIANGSISLKGLLESQKELRRINLNLTDTAESEVDCDVFESARLYWGKMACRVNAGMVKYQETVLRELKAEGHQILTGDSIDSDTAAGIQAEVKGIKLDSMTAFSRMVQDAETITDAQAENLETIRSKTFDEQLQLSKHRTAKRYGVEVTDEVYLRDCEGWHPKIQLHYYLTTGRENLKLRDQSKRKELTDQGQAWEPDLNSSLLSAQVAILEFLGIPELLQKPEFKSSDPDMQAFQQAAIEHRFKIKDGLNVTIKGGEKPDTPVRAFSKFLEKLGLKLVCIRKEGGKGKQERVYKIGTVDEILDEKAEKLANNKNPLATLPERWQIFAPDDGRECVFAAWFSRDMDRAEKSASTPSEQPTTPTESPKSEGNIKMYRGDTVVTPGNKNINTEYDYQFSDYQKSDTKSCSDYDTKSETIKTPIPPINSELRAEGSEPELTEQQESEGAELPGGLEAAAWVPSIGELVEVVSLNPGKWDLGKVVDFNAARKCWIVEIAGWLGAIGRTRQAREPGKGIRPALALDYT